jgi:hypothetical protein
MRLFFRGRAPVSLLRGRREGILVGTYAATTGTLIKTAPRYLTAMLALNCAAALFLFGFLGNIGFATRVIGATARSPVNLMPMGHL